MGGFGHHVFTVRSDKDDHFTSAIASMDAEEENLSMPAALGGRSRIAGIRIISIDNLAWAPVFFGNGQFTSDTDIDLAMYLGHHIFAVGDGYQRNNTGPYYYFKSDLDIVYQDLDHPAVGVSSSPKLHMGISNRSLGAKTAGINGALVIDILMVPTN